MVKQIRAKGGELEFDSEVTQLPRKSRWTICTRSGDYEADFLINCAGLHCDGVSRKAGSRDEAKIVPFRGEIYTLRPERQHSGEESDLPGPGSESFRFWGCTSRG